MKEGNAVVTSLRGFSPTPCNHQKYTPMIRRSHSRLALGGVLILAACAQTPMGPTIQVMPGPGKSFANFQSDQAVCRQFADQAVSDQAQGANLRGLATTALTTALARLIHQSDG